MKPHLPCALLGTLLAVSNAGAAIISFNFTDNGTPESTMLPDDVAGAPGVAVANWNNLNVNGAGPTSRDSLIYDNGASVLGASVTWQTDLGQWRLPHAVEDGHDRMWKGYLDSQNSATITVTGLSFDTPYDVYIYFDGANASQWRIANFAIGDVSAFGEDSENTNWGAGQNEAKLYQIPVPGTGGNQPFPTSPNNSEGNYVILRGITGSDFVINVTNGPNAGTARAPVNGFQIVPVPEPTAAALGLLGTAVLLRRRRTTEA